MGRALRDFARREDVVVATKFLPLTLVGVMAQNTASAAKEPHVWSTGNQEIK